MPMAWWGAVWGIPNLLALSVTLSARWESSIQSGACASGLAHKALLFKTVADMSHPQLSILLQPWAHVGPPSLSLRSLSLRMPDRVRLAVQLGDVLAKCALFHNSRWRTVTDNVRASAYMSLFEASR